MIQPPLEMTSLSGNMPRTFGQQHHHPPATFNPFIYGNDIDSVDVATRVAMVSMSGISDSHIMSKFETVRLQLVIEFCLLNIFL